MKNNSDLIRTALALLQALIDTALYWLSFYIVITFWLSGRTPSILSFEVRAFFTGTMLAVFYFNSLYDFRNWIVWDELKAILKSAALILLVIVLYLYSQKVTMSRFILAAGILFFVPMCLFARYAFRRIFFALGLLRTSIIILGAGRAGEIFAKKILEHPFSSCMIIGFLDDNPHKQGKIIAGFPVLGRLDEFEKVYANHDIDEAAVAISTASRSLLTHILDMVEFHVRQVHYIPDMYMLTTFSPSIRDVDGVPVISASQGLLNPLNRAVKVIMDYIGAIIALVIVSPIMLWAAYRIKREDGGPVLIEQERVGWKAEHFNVYRFRTMNGRNATRIGRVLRRTRAYKLPQLFNVLRGEMSLSGPEPMTQRDSDLTFGERVARKIFAVKPGITGFWQMGGRSDSEMCRDMNLYYVRNWSAWLDIVIILRTAYDLLH